MTYTLQATRLDRGGDREMSICGRGQAAELLSSALAADPKLRGLSVCQYYQLEFNVRKLLGLSKFLTIRSFVRSFVNVVRIGYPLGNVQVEYFRRAFARLGGDKVGLTPLPSRFAMKG